MGADEGGMGRAVWCCILEALCCYLIPYECCPCCCCCCRRYCFGDYGDGDDACPAAQQDQRKKDHRQENQDKNDIKDTEDGVIRETSDNYFDYYQNQPLSIQNDKDNSECEDVKDAENNSRHQIISLAPNQSTTTRTRTKLVDTREPVGDLKRSESFRIEDCDRQQHR